MSARDNAAEAGVSEHREFSALTSHDQSILHETKLPTDPVTLEADEHLTDNDTDDLEVSDRGDPVGVALLVGGPACGPHGRVERSKVTDGEEAG
jgi:hypothetical protein